MASLPPSRQPMLAAVGRGNVGGPEGGPDARRWSASYSRDPVVMIVMSVRAASSELLWGWNAASGPARSSVPLFPSCCPLPRSVI